MKELFSKKSKLTKSNHCVTCSADMESQKTKSFSYRPRLDHADRINALIEATEHAKAFFLDKALASHLPALEKRYERELAEYRARAMDVSLNDAPTNAPQPTPRVITSYKAAAASERRANSRLGQPVPPKPGGAAEPAP